jgi:hypothetical protein
MMRRAIRLPVCLILALLPALANGAPGLGDEAPLPEQADAQATIWPYQEPLYTLYAPPSSFVRLRSGYANNPDLDSLAFSLEGAVSFGSLDVHLRMPLGLAMGLGDETEFTWGDLELGVRWLIHREPANQRHLAVGLDLITPTSRIGEQADVAAVQTGELADDSNFAKRYLLAQKPLLDMGLVPRPNLGVTPWVAFGQNLGRVSLQADFGCLLLIMDNIDETVYGTDQRFGALMFFDLAAPVAIAEGLSLVAEFNALVALGSLSGTGFAFTLGPRYTHAGFTAGLGVQLPLGIDNDPPDDDKMLGRYEATSVARHHLAALLDLAYRF